MAGPGLPAGAAAHNAACGVLCHDGDGHGPGDEQVRPFPHGPRLGRAARRRPTFGAEGRTRREFVLRNVCVVPAERPDAGDRTAAARRTSARRPCDVRESVLGRRENEAGPLAGALAVAVASTVAPDEETGRVASSPPAAPEPSLGTVDGEPPPGRSHPSAPPGRPRPLALLRPHPR